MPTEKIFHHESNPQMKFMSQGAEAVIYAAEKEGKPIVIKERIPKIYRNPILDDKIRRFRTKREIKVLKTLKDSSVNVPSVIFSEKYSFGMELVSGKKLRDILSSDNIVDIATKLAKQISIMHDIGIIHGDLTTSNMILDEKGEVNLIDFGLSFFSFTAEDKAVDLHLFKQAIISKHHEIADDLIEEFLNNYNPEQKKEITKKLTSVEMRGRNKAK